MKQVHESHARLFGRCFCRRGVGFQLQVVSLPVGDVWVARVFMGNRAEQDNSRERLSVGFRAACLPDKFDKLLLIVGRFLDAIE